MVQVLQMEQVTHTQQHMMEQVQPQHINMEMQHTKQADGMKITRTLWFRTALSFTVEVTVAMALAHGCSTIATAMGVPPAAARSVCA